MSFGAQLRVLREARGWTQGQLAEHAGVSKANVANLEQGRVGPTWETVQALGDALGVDCTAFRAVGGAAGKSRRPRGRPKKAKGLGHGQK